MDWLTEALRETVIDSEGLTPFERRFRRRFLSELDDEEDLAVRDARNALRGIAKSTPTLRDDAEAVLGLLDEDDEALADVIDELDALVRISRGGGVTLSEAGGDAFWRGLLLSQIRHKLERAQRKSAGNQGYTEAFGNP